VYQSLYCYMMVRCSAVLLTCGAIKRLTCLAQSVLLIKSSLYFVVSWQFFQLIILFLLKAGKPTGPNGSRYLDPSDLILALCDLETFDLLISKLIVSSPCIPLTICDKLQQNRLVRFVDFVLKRSDVYTCSGVARMLIHDGHELWQKSQLST